MEETDFDREKWRAQCAQADRTLQQKDRELDINQSLAKATIDEKRRSRWTNPLVIAIIAAAVAATGNGIVALLNLVLEDRKAINLQNVEEIKAESARIFEMIRAENQDDAVRNLQFLLKTGLISNKDRAKSLKEYLDTLQPGQAALLPAPLAENRSANGVIVQLATYHRTSCVIAQKELNRYKSEFSPPPSLWLVPPGNYIVVGIRANDEIQAKALRDQAVSLAPRFRQENLQNSQIRTNVSWAIVNSCEDLKPN